MVRFYWYDERGATALMFALILPVLLAFVGAAVDYSDLVSKRQVIQVTVDEAALAAAKLMTNSILTGSQLQQAVTTAATSVARAKVPQATPTVTVSMTGYNGGIEDAVTVAMSYSKPLLFGAFFVGQTATQIGARAKARPGYAPRDCVIALDPSSTKSFSVSGNGSVSVPNCGIRVNSSQRNALSQQGSGSLTGKSINVVGQYAGNGYTPMPSTGQAAAVDPLANIAEPTPPPGCTYYNTAFSVPTTFSGGSTFCGNISFTASAIFSPGIYYFKFATVSTGGNTNLTGTNMMWYFDALSSLNSTTSGDISLSGMTSGPYAGIALFGSRSAPNLPTFHFTGGTSYIVNGTIYLPAGRFEFFGNSSLTVKSGYVIAQQFSYQGNSSFVMDTFGGTAPSGLASKDLALTQ